jgi:hypothetical protein
MSVTPSQWHDDVRGRDAGHDDMQIAVFNHCRGLAPHLGQTEISGKPCVHGGVFFEFPFVRRDRVVSFGDVVEIWREDTTRGAWARVIVWEIKPKIYNVGAVMRQCLALEIAAVGALREGGWREPLVWACPVVPSDDPKLAALRHVFRAAEWDGRLLRLKQQQLEAAA